MTKEERIQRSVAYHGQGYNCSQSVLLACGDLTGLEETAAARLACCFGSGMQCGEVCGAVTGGLMAIGACMPHESALENKPLVGPAARELEAAFREEFGSLLCREILAQNGKRICDQCISCSAAAAAGVIEKLRQGDDQK